MRTASLKNSLLNLTSVMLLTLVGLAACDSTTAEQHYARAETSLADAEIRTAVIELKNALQKNPDFADARLLLGETHARLGDYASALKEFERALDLGLDNDRVRLGLLDAKVRLGRHQEVIGELEDTGALSAPFAVVLADAYLAGGDLDRAKVLYQQGLALSGGNLGLGSIAWQQGDLERAAHYLSEAVRLDPGNGDAWLRKAEFELNQRSFEDAAASFAAAVEVPSASLLGRTGLARVKLLQGDTAGAAGDVDAALKMAPQFPPAQYLSGLISYEQEELEAAEAAIREVQRVAPDHGPSLYLMGAIKYRQGQLSQAEDSLQRHLAQNPRNDSAAKLLASVRFDRDDLDGVLDVLEPLQASTQDPQILAMYGATQLRLGNAAEATQALERAVALAPDMAPFRNQLALSLLSAGEQARAEAELESAIEVDAGQFQSDYLLAMLRLRDEDWDGAMAAAEGLVAKNEDSPVGYNLRGAAALGAGDTEAAAAHFRIAIDKDPAFLPAVQNLSRLAEQNGDVATARSLYEDLLAQSPGNEGALVNLADLALRQSDVAGALQYLEQAAGANPESVRARLGLARLQLAQGRVEDADSTVDGALALAPEQPDLLLLRAEIDLRSGNQDAAGRIASQLQSVLAGYPDNEALHQAVGGLQARVGQLTLARNNLATALALSDGTNVSALRTLTRLDLRDRDTAAAQERLSRLRELGDEGPAFDLLQADVRLAAGDREDAIAGYTALAEQGVREGVVRLASLNLGAGDVDAAIGLLDDWLAGNEQDLGAELLMAEAFMRQARTDEAVKRYERLVETDNPVVLNNLAWLYMERGDERALGIARRAVAAAPDSADALDTLGWILLQQGENAEALRLLRRSDQLKPGNPSVEYHLGIALRDTGDVEAARRTLEKALQAGSFPEAEAARAALSALPGA